TQPAHHFPPPRRSAAAPGQLRWIFGDYYRNPLIAELPGNVIAALVRVLPAPGGAGEAGSGAITLDGDVTTLGELAALLDDFEPTFPIVTP
ncbi:alkyl sulfatase C-terminal domain-containing protein, partial [Nocardia sp. NPDC101769]|uniref:alkyl sulfatase C-terminal domain-containing protein n=1 Tax=Nocardia sp. NPDC101769 TaxID=3364333 RepID=UPI003808700E